MARAEHEHPGTYGVWSTGERCAVALILNKASILPEGYTFLDAVDRITGDPILEDALLVNRRGWRE